MGLYLLFILVVLTIGPIAMFHKGQTLEEDNKVALILPLGVCLIYGYCLITKQYETKTGFYILVIAFLLSIYSTICSIIMYVQYTNQKANEANREKLKEEIKEELQSKSKQSIKCQKCGYSFPVGSEKNFCPRCGYKASAHSRLKKSKYFS